MYDSNPLIAPHVMSIYCINGTLSGVWVGEASIIGYKPNKAIRLGWSYPLVARLAENKPMECPTTPGNQTCSEL